MSWDLLVFATSAPASVLDARDLLGDEDDPFGWDEPEFDQVDPRVTAFLDDLLAELPALEDHPPRDRAVWNVSPSPDGPTSTYLCIRYSMIEPAFEAVLRLAPKHGLVVYDPQADTITNPPWPAYAGTRLALCNGSLTADPSPVQIADSLETLSHDNWYAILERETDEYVQAALEHQNPLGRYVLEHRDGGADRHYTTYVDDAAKLEAAFIGFAMKTDDWNSRLSWQRVEIS